MSKLIAPLFSIRASGSLAETLTFRTGRKDTVATSIPTHPDASSNAQRRHRFLYKVGIGLWNGMTPAQQAIYSAQAVGRPLTALNLWMRLWLDTAPGLTLALPIESPPASTVHDVSPFHTHLTIYGAEWSPSPPPYSLSFDGVDDYAQVITAMQLNFTTGPYSFMLSITNSPTPPTAHIMGRGTQSADYYFLRADSNGRLRWTVRADAGIFTTLTSPGALLPSATQTLAVTRSGSTINLYVDDLDRTTLPPSTTDLDIANRSFTLGWNPALGGTAWKGSIHWLLAFSQELTPAEVTALTSALLNF
ncbi:hypothetical protein LCGC14_1192150 [marine sediment metagenome]|uniref:LamG-like jellyroll fold domain-containing protein n=1 Tax=marine sediment metagenome TaxID=412755 RepID=A0A0F9P1R6_9ZZZZ